mgnify:CR=1 FL=1
MRGSFQGMWGILSVVAALASEVGVVSALLGGIPALIVAGAFLNISMLAGGTSPSLAQLQNNTIIGPLTHFSFARYALSVRC